MAETSVTIIKRPRKKNHQPHGGAWKVAYADFVTAMMALFIVLWLLTSSEQVKKTVGGYFTDPKGQGRDVGNGLRGAGAESLLVREQEMSALKQKLAEALKETAPMQKLREHVKMTVTNEGLRIELSEGEQNAFFFESGSPLPTDFGREILSKLAAEISTLPNKIVIEGHTDSRPFGFRTDYSNWELSSDRANSARRLMEKVGVRPDQVVEIRGYGDEKPRDGASPGDAANRRVTVIIQYQVVGAAPSTKE